MIGQQLHWSRTTVKHLSILLRQRNKEIEGEPHEKLTVLKRERTRRLLADVYISHVIPGACKKILPLHT